MVGGRGLRIKLGGKLEFGMVKKKKRREKEKRKESVKAKKMERAHSYSINFQAHLFDI